MFLKPLLVSCFVLVAFTGIRCHDSGTNNQNAGTVKKETAKQAPAIITSGAKDCLRECKEGEPPKTCYYYFVLELYPVLGKACEFCTPNNTNAIESNCQCIVANGYERIASVVNRMLPGPSIQVCKGDKIIVDVENNLEGMETSIHWYGLHQNRTQYNDGASTITQCPIPQGTTFRYEFYADNVGTHWWRSQLGLQCVDGVYGSFIVRQPKFKVPNSRLYDYDLSEHTMLISDWLNTPAISRFPGTLNVNPGQHPVSVLINGKGQWTNPQTGKVTDSPSEVFVIERGCSYRFRMINAFFMVCPAELTIEKHTLTIIAADGSPIRPENVSTIISFSGDRYDFVLNGDQHPGAYWIQVRAIGKCRGEKIQQTAILIYKGISGTPKSKQPTYDEQLPHKIVLNPMSQNYTWNASNSVRITDLKSAHPVDKKMLQKTPDLKFYIPANFIQYQLKDLFESNTYDHFLVAPDKRHVLGYLGGVSFMNPPSPMISQMNDIPRGTICTADDIHDDSVVARRCTNIINIPFGSDVEIIIVDERGLSDLMIPFHLHGYSFYVVGAGHAPDPSVTKISAEYIRHYDSKYSLDRNCDQPVLKDTIAVPTNGYVIVRMCADNAGYWLLQNQIAFQRVIGSAIVLHVGNSSHLPPVPSGFPVCGNYIPPIKPIDYQKCKSHGC